MLPIDIFIIVQVVVLATFCYAAMKRGGVYIRTSLLAALWLFAFLAAQDITGSYTPAFASIIITGLIAHCVKTVCDTKASITLALGLHVILSLYILADFCFMLTTLIEGNEPEWRRAYQHVKAGLFYSYLIYNGFHGTRARHNDTSTDRFRQVFSGGGNGRGRGRFVKSSVNPDRDCR